MVPERNAKVDDFPVELYLRKQNTVVIPYRRALTMFDRVTPNYKFDGLMRILGNLPSKPRVVPINYYEFVNMDGKEKREFAINQRLLGGEH